MLKKSILMMFIGVIAGCSSVSSYNQIADSVNYSYDHNIKQSLIKGPSDTSEPYGAKVKDFHYDLVIKDFDTHVNVAFSYKDSSPRNYTHVVNSAGERIEFSRHENKILKCGVRGTFNQGKCNFSEDFTFKMPRESHSNWAVVGNANKNVYFEVSKTYVSVMNDFVYKLKTPRSDVDEGKIKKESLIAAKPVAIKKPDATIPANLIKNSSKPVVNQVITPTGKPIVSKAATVSVPAVQKPLITTKNIPVASKKGVINKNTSNCATNSKATNNVYKPDVKKNPVLTPLDIKSFCSCVKFKNSCAEVTSCREAYDQLACGNKKLDPTNKGMPCPNVCKM